MFRLLFLQNVARVADGGPFAGCCDAGEWPGRGPHLRLYLVGLFHHHCYHYHCYYHVGFPYLGRRACSQAVVFTRRAKRCSPVTDCMSNRHPPSAGEGACVYPFHPPYTSRRCSPSRVQGGGIRLINFIPPTFTRIKLSSNPPPPPPPPP